MKKQSPKNKVLSVLLAVALCLPLLPTVTLAAGNTHTVTNQAEFETALRDANDGDTICISGSVTLMENDQDALVIDKNVTITRDTHTDGKLIVRYSGILLGADVTFQNISLQFPSRSRNAILANGYTLTLENVEQDTTNGQQIHLFCGGMTGYAQANLPLQGEHGKIIIKGNTSIGNIYAGSISSDGQTNSFDRPATITITDTATGTLGCIYASGALETPAGKNQFDTSSEVAPPTPSVIAPRDYTVTGDVTIQLYKDLVRQVDGTTGGSRNAAVKFNGDRYRVDNVVLANIASLSVISGTFVPAEGSSFSGTGASVSVSVDTTLGLNHFGGRRSSVTFPGADP